MRINSDLLCEIAKNFRDNQISFDAKSKFKKYLFNIKTENFSITTNNDSDVFNKPKGDYLLIDYNNIDNFINNFHYCKNILINSIKKFVPKKLNNVLVVGLGNRYIISDSLGSKVSKYISVTNNLVDLKTITKVSCICPSVLGLTGIESCDIVSAIIEKIKPDLTIIIDSLCASDINRLAVSVQLNNAEIIPGAGINNARKKINSNKIKSNILVIGVPLIIHLNTLIDSVMQFKEIGYDKEKYLNQLVTVQNIDILIEKLSKVIAFSINNVLIGVDSIEI